MVVVVMGVSGSGKTSIGRALATHLEWPFIDADEVHPPENVDRMRAGIPLTDADREPWLAALRALVRRTDAAGENLVLACSALRRSFRKRLRDGVANLRFVHLQAGPELVARRLAARTGHFMNPDLHDSQFDALEEPEDAVVLDAAEPPDVLVARIRRALGV